MGDKIDSDNPGEVFDNLAKYLLLMQHWNKEPVTKDTTASKHYKNMTEKVGSTKNIRLWNQNQLNAIRYFYKLLQKLLQAHIFFIAFLN